MQGDRDRYYSIEQIGEILNKAEDLGFVVNGTELNKLSLAEIERLVNTKQ